MTLKTIIQDIYSDSETLSRIRSLKAIHKEVCEIQLLLFQINIFNELSPVYENMEIEKVAKVIKNNDSLSEIKDRLVKIKEIKDRLTTTLNMDIENQKKSINAFKSFFGKIDEPLLEEKAKSLLNLLASLPIDLNAVKIVDYHRQEEKITSIHQRFKQKLNILHNNAKEKFNIELNDKIISNFINGKGVPYNEVSPILESVQDDHPLKSNLKVVFSL